MRHRFYLIALISAAVLGWVENSHGRIEACDGEWHRGGYPDWQGISFSESNHPDLTPDDEPPPTRKKKKRRKKAAKKIKAKQNIVVVEEIPEG